MTKRRIFSFFAAFLLYNLAANFAHPVTPTMIVERQLDSSMFGVAFAAMMAMNFLFSPFWGKLGDYIPTKILLLISGLGYAVGQMFFLLARSDAAMIGARMFAGVFVGCGYTGFSNYIINTAANAVERDSRLTIYFTINSVSAACGYFIGGMLGLISTECSILLQVLCLGFSGVLFYLVCVDDTPFKKKPENALTLREVNPFRAFLTIRAHMTTMLALIFCIVAVSAIGQNSYEQCFNYYIKDQYSMSSAYNGTFKALIALVTLVLNSTVCITLQKKTDINKTFLYILEACSALIALILVFRGQLLFVGVYILYSSVNVIRLPLLQSMIARRATPESRNSLIGFYQSMTSLGGIFGALFAGIIYKQGPMLPFLLAFLTYLVSTGIGLIYTAKYRKE